MFFNPCNLQARITTGPIAEIISLQHAPPPHHGLHIHFFITPYQEVRHLSLLTSLVGRNIKGTKLKGENSSRRNWLRERVQRGTIPPPYISLLHLPLLLSCPPMALVIACIFKARHIQLPFK